MSMLAQQQYRQNSITTAAPGELTLMLYKGAVRFVNATKRSIQEGKVEEAHNYNVRTQEIIRELMVTLNMEYPISKNLMSLYEYLLQQLIKANIEKNIEILDEVKGFLEDFIATWEQAMKMARQK